MRRDTWIQIAAAGAMVVFLGASAVLTPAVAASLGRNRLVYSDTAEAGDPPEVAVGIAMGAFRGLFVNFLWIRANNLKEAGKYHEAVDLSSTITKLQPRFPKVWAFHAWNLAYNISVATQTREERWNWVRAGIELLRSKGVPANPNDITLHKELAWIHLHKIQGVMDDAHWYYKRQFAREWTAVLGAPPTIGVARVGGDEAKEAFVKWLRAIADAPDTLEGVYRKAPAARGLVERLRREAGLEPDRLFLERFAEVESQLNVAVMIGRPEMLAGDPLAMIVADPANHEAGKALIAHVRKRVLVDEYHMEPERMIRYTRKYGPMDWRHPASHAVYWSARGVEQALLRVNEQNRTDFDFLNTDRLTMQALQELFRTGTLFYDINNEAVLLGLPNAYFIPSYGEALDEIVERTKGTRYDAENRTYKFYAAGYENFLRDAIRYLYRRGDKDLAAFYYQKLRTWLPLNTNNPSALEQLSATLDDFVVNEILNENRETSPQVATQEIAGALEQAFVDGLLNGNAKVFESAFGYAQRFHQLYQSKQSFRTWVAGEQGRMGFPPFDIMAGSTLAGMTQAVGLPHGPRMYRAAPPELRARAYVFLEGSPVKEAMDAGKEQSGIGFDTWFPPPPNVDAVRAEIKQTIQSLQPDHERAAPK